MNADGKGPQNTRPTLTPSVLSAALTSMAWPALRDRSAFGKGRQACPGPPGAWGWLLGGRRLSSGRVLPRCGGRGVSLLRGSVRGLCCGPVGTSSWPGCRAGAADLGPGLRTHRGSLWCGFSGEGVYCPRRPQWSAAREPTTRRGKGALESGPQSQLHSPGPPSFSDGFLRSHRPPFGSIFLPQAPCTSAVRDVDCQAPCGAGLEWPEVTELKSRVWI